MMLYRIGVFVGKRVMEGCESENECVSLAHTQKEVS